MLDFQIKVREDILREEDGPMLLYGIQRLHDQAIILPRSKNFWPDQERLEIRYKMFKEAG